MASFIMFKGKKEKTESVHQHWLSSHSLTKLVKEVNEYSNFILVIFILGFAHLLGERENLFSVNMHENKKKEKEMRIL